MSFQKTFIFDPKDLVNLLTHYSEGLIPLDCEIKEVMFNPFLKRMIGLELDSESWETIDPLHFRYDTKRVMSWSKASNQEPVWDNAPDAPNRQ